VSIHIPDIHFLPIIKDILDIMTTFFPERSGGEEKKKNELPPFHRGAEERCVHEGTKKKEERNLIE